MTLINYQVKSLAFNQIYSSNFYQLKSLFNFLCYSHITVTFQRSKRASFSGQFISYFLDITISQKFVLIASQNFGLKFKII